MRSTPALALATLLAAGSAWAQGGQGERERAHAVYDQGTRAYRRGDFAAAAARYAEADTLAPSPVALQAALDAAVKADDPVLGAELLERARGRRVEGRLAASVRAATAKLAHRAGKITPTCPGPCDVTIDGAPATAGRARWVGLGAHAVAFSIGGRSETRSVSVAADADVTVGPTPAPPPTYTVAQPQPQPQPQSQPEPQSTPSGLPAPPSPPAPTATGTPGAPARTPPAETAQPLVERRHGGRGGLSPAWFWVSLGGTAAFTAASVALLAVTKSTHDQFVTKACSSTDSADCRSLASQGSTTMALGDVFLVAAVAGAVWTTVAGAALVRWHAAVEVAPGPHGAAVFWRMTF